MSEFIYECLLFVQFVYFVILMVSIHRVERKLDRLAEIVFEKEKKNNG